LIPNYVAARGPCIGRLRFPYGRVLAGAVLRIAPGWLIHADAVGFDGMVPASIVHNLMVVFNGIPIRSCPKDEELDASAED
jgi:hypothetical protein